MLTVKGYFSPENFGIMNLALGLGERDYGVTILTGKRNYPAGQLFAEQELLARSRENYSGNKVARVFLLPGGGSV